MRWRVLILLFTLIITLVPGVALAQETGTRDDFLLRIDGPVRLGPDEVAGTVMVISDDAVIEGVVEDTLIVIDGTATVSGRVDADVIMVNGTLNLEPTARVNDVSLFDSQITEAQGSTITGTITRASDVQWGWGLTVFSIIWWFAVTIVLLAAALLFAAIGGRQFTEAGSAIVRRPGETILSALIVGIGFPILAIALLVTVLGIPLGLGLLVFILPALWFLGYLVSGMQLGASVLTALGRSVNSEHPYLAALLGVLILQIVGLIPFLGPLIGFLAGVIGAGALALVAWRAWRGTGPARGEPAPAGRPAPTA